MALEVEKNLAQSQQVVEAIKAQVAQLQVKPDADNGLEAWLVEMLGVVREQVNDNEMLMKMAVQIFGGKVEEEKEGITGLD